MKSFSLFSALTGTSLTPGRRAFLTGTLLLTSTGLICRVLGFFYRIFLSRMFGEEGMGIYELMNPVLSLTFALCTSGIQSAVSKFTAGQSGPSRTADRLRILLSGMLFSGILSAGCAALIYRCSEFIVAHLSDPQLDVGMLCDELKVSRSTLTQIFTARMGCAPGRYIRDHRMAHGIALLRGTSLPVNEIAHRCGFAEARSFSRFIRRGTRLSPLELRKQGGGNCPPASGATKTES